MAHRIWPDALTGDKGYSSEELRNWLLLRDIEAVIPYWNDERGPKDDTREHYRERPIIERTVNRLKPGGRSADPVGLSRFSREFAHRRAGPSRSTAVRAASPAPSSKRVEASVDALFKLLGASAPSNKSASARGGLGRSA